VTLGCQNYTFEDWIDANRLFLTSKLSRSDLVERQVLEERMYRSSVRFPEFLLQSSTSSS